MESLIRQGVRRNMLSEDMPYAEAYASEMTLREMMEEYGSDVWNYAFFLTRSREQANDISQEVFLKAYKNVGKYRGQSSMKTWLLTITRNTAFSWSKNSFWRRFIPFGSTCHYNCSVCRKRSARQTVCEPNLGNYYDPTR